MNNDVELGGLIENNDLYSIKQSTEDINTIKFFINEEEQIKISPDGFYWKGNLVVKDTEIYNDFKAFLQQTKTIPTTKLNSVEEYQNLLESVKNVLKFYANIDNYHQNQKVDGEPKNLVNIDGGFQANFILNHIEDLEEKTEKLNQEYNVISTASSGDEKQIKELVEYTKNMFKNGIKDI